MFHPSTWIAATAPAAPASGAAYRPDIDGLRAVAVLSVVLHHLTLTLLPGGFVGVDVFFVISGYLITGIIARELGEGRFSLYRFYERRARRIFPALFAMLAATVVACLAIMLPTDLIAAFRAALGTIAFSSNVVFWNMGESYFEEADTRTNPLLHTWSLGVEEQFYVLFPLFLYLCFRWAARRVELVLAVCAVLSLAAAVLLVRRNATAAFYLSPFRGWELLAGGLLALGAVRPARTAWLREGLVAGGLCAILVACIVYDESTLFPGAAAALPVVGAMAVIHGGSAGGTIAGRVLSTRPMVYLGLISYSLYLWHWPVLVLAQYLNGMGPVTKQAGLLLAISLSLAALSYHFVERPLRRPASPERRGRGLRQVSVFGVVTAGIFAAGLFTAGFPGRFDPSIVALDAQRRQPLPHLECNDRLPADACRIGAEGVAPTVLLWGDSHLMAWAPALQEILAARNTSALLVVSTGCAPLLGLESQFKRRCNEFSAAVRAHLETHAALRTVLMSAFWSTYFRDNGPLRWVPAEGDPLEGAPAATKGLDTTVRWLLDQQRAVVLLGPVPTYDRNIPAALAIQARDGVRRLDLAREPQERTNAQFQQAVAGLPAVSKLRVVEPMAWMCRSECVVSDAGKPLYRDAHHLSMEGARAYRNQIANALGLDVLSAP